MVVNETMIDELLEFLEERYGVTEDELHSRNKTFPIPFARQEGYYLLREAGYSLGAIGKIFGRSHSTVLKSLRNLDQDDKLKIDNSYREWARARREGGFMLIELSFPDGTKFTGFMRAITDVEIFERAFTVEKNYRCEVRVLRTRMTLSAAKEAENMTKLKQHIVGG